MVKIVSLIIFIAALILSWCAFNSQSNMGIDVHAGVQSKLTILIEDTIKAQRPSSENFKLIHMHTEKMDDQKIMAHFSYEFEDQLLANDESASDKTTQKISGSAILSKGLSEDPSIQKWVLQSVKTGNETVDFKDGLTIVSDGTSPEVPANESAPATENK